MQRSLCCSAFCSMPCPRPHPLLCCLLPALTYPLFCFLLPTLHPYVLLCFLFPASCPNLLLFLFPTLCPHVLLYFLLPALDPWVYLLLCFLLHLMPMSLATCVPPAPTLPRQGESGWAATVPSGSSARTAAAPPGTGLSAAAESPSHGPAAPYTWGSGPGTGCGGQQTDKGGWFLPKAARDESGLPGSLAISCSAFCSLQSFPGRVSSPHPPCQHEVGSRRKAALTESKVLWS